MNDLRNAQAIKIKPFYVPKPWGGTHFKSLCPLDYPHPIGEIILLSTLDQFPNYIDVSNDMQITFQNYWLEVGEPYLRNHFAQTHNLKKFPFMLKLLSLERPLSIQVHPSAPDLQKFFNDGGMGKDESWAILQAHPETCLYLGVNEKYSLVDFKKAMGSNEILSYLNQYQPLAGEVYHLPAGLPHGTKGTLLLYEIQQSSDHTFRIFDFDRGRALATHEAKQVVRDIQTSIQHYHELVCTLFYSFQAKNIVEKHEYHVENEFIVITYLGPKAILQTQKLQFDLQWGDTIFCWHGLIFSFHFVVLDEITLNNLPHNKPEDAIFLCVSMNPS